MPENWDGSRSTGAAPRAQLPPSTRATTRGTNRLVLLGGVVVVVLVTALAALMAWKLTTPSAEPAPTTTLTPTPAPVTATTTSPPVVRTPATATATASASATNKPLPPIPEDRVECFASLLPPDAFKNRKPNLDECCTGTRGYNTALVLKSAVVVGGGRYDVTEAMKEFSRLGWYETAAFAVMRAHCCPDAPALSAPRRLAKCKMEEALAYLANAIDDPEDMRDAVRAYSSAAQCISKAGASESYGRWAPPAGGELMFFERVMNRVRKARGHD